MAVEWSDLGINPLVNPWNACSPNLSALFQYFRTRWGGETLGCHNDRPVTGGTRWSAHAFGAALDVRFSNRAETLVVLDWLTRNWSPLGVLRINDYFAQREWENDTRFWRNVSLQSGDWIHVETTHAMWGNATPITSRNLVEGDGDLTPEQAGQLNACTLILTQLQAEILNAGGVKSDAEAAKVSSALAATKAEQARVEAAAAKTQATLALQQATAVNLELDTVRASDVTQNATLDAINQAAQQILNILQALPGGSIPADVVEKIRETHDALRTAAAAITTSTG